MPRVINALKDVPCIDISARRDHSLILSQSRKIYSCGIGDGGRLGHGDEENLTIPCVINILEDIPCSSVSAGGMHSLVLSDSGKVYSFGWGEKGQLGHGNKENQLIPRVISAIENIRCVSIVASGDKSFIVSDSEQIYFFGLKRLGVYDVPIASEWEKIYDAQLYYGDNKAQMIPCLFKGRDSIVESEDRDE